MNQFSGQAGAAVFAASGSARHRLVRAAIAASAALLAAWLIALALGVLGGFDSLPGLPSSHPTGSSEASSNAKGPPAPARASVRTHPSAPVVKTAAQAPVSGNSTGRTQSQSSTPKSTTKQVVQAPTAPAAATSTTSTTHGKGTTRTTGKPVGSPGNGAGGFGAPGQLR